MNSRWIPPVVLLFAFAMTACQTGVAPLSDEDIAAIRSLHDEWIPAMTSGDWDALNALYTEDCVVMPPNQPIIEGRSAARASQGASPPITEATLTIDEIDGYGDLAYVRGTYTMTVVVNEQPIQDRGKYIEIRRKQPDGSWLISRDIFNSDLPLPPAEGEHSEGEEHT